MEFGAKLLKKKKKIKLLSQESVSKYPGFDFHWDVVLLNEDCW